MMFLSVRKGICIRLLQEALQAEAQIIRIVGGAHHRSGPPDPANGAVHSLIEGLHPAWIPAGDCLKTDPPCKEARAPEVWRVSDLHGHRPSMKRWIRLQCLAFVCYPDVARVDMRTRQWISRNGLSLPSNRGSCRSQCGIEKTVTGTVRGYWKRRVGRAVYELIDDDVRILSINWKREFGQLAIPGEDGIGSLIYSTPTLREANGSWVDFFPPLEGHARGARP
jgi:hypothetical protein